MICQDFPVIKGKEPNWRKLVQRGVLQRRSWADLADFAYLTSDDLQTLSSEFFETLRAPQLPLLKLRREGVSLLGTTLQEILADALTAEPDPLHLVSLTESVVQTLDEFANELFHEVRTKQFDMPIEQDLLVIARWNLFVKKTSQPSLGEIDCRGIAAFRNESLMASTWSAASTNYTTSYEDPSQLELTYVNYPLNEAQALMLRLYSVINESSAFHCKLLSRLLGTHGDLIELSSHYVNAVRPTQWNAYCAAVSTIDADFKPFSLLLNDICNAKHEDMPKSPPFSVMRLMVAQWRRQVFTPLKESLLQASLLLLTRQRAHLLSTFNAYKSFCSPQEISGLGCGLQKRQQQSELTLLSK
jgi:hypothetical protein